MGFAQDLIVIDVETTGTDVTRGHEAIQFAAVRLDGKTLDEKGRFSSLVQCTRPECADEVAMNIHKIPMERILEAPHPKDVVRMAEEALLTPKEREGTGRVNVLLAGQNTQFDFAFLKEMFKHAGLRGDRWGYHVLDLYSFVQLEIARGNWTGATDKVTLDSICQAVGLARQTDLHDALEDVLLTAEALRRVVGRVQSREGASRPSRGRYI